MSEWLEADGLGGFASGTIDGVRTRRYHALLLTATQPPVGRMVLVNGIDAFVSSGESTREFLTAQRYEPGVTAPESRAQRINFDLRPWPCWTFRLADGGRVVQELFVVHGTGALVMSWCLVRGTPRTLTVRPFLSGRDYHALHHENPSFRFEAESRGAGVRWAPYAGVPGVNALTNGSYLHDPCWYRGFRYEEERARGLDSVEDLASPGAFRFELGEREALLVLSADGTSIDPADAQAFVARSRNSEGARRASFATPLHRAADAYLVKRGNGRTIVAGYPWFADWGRDTFIALRGLCLATGRFADARDILVEWAAAVDHGMLPNRFPDGGEPPEYNSGDAALWYVVAVDAYLRALEPDAGTRRTLIDAVERILVGHARGTRYGIAVDDDALLRAGAPGVQLTWMDARVGDRVITPRSGKPVEIQALWLNALHAGARLGTPSAARWRRLFERGRAAFAARFWNEERGCLYDVIDVEHQRGLVDGTVRPNQIFAVGGLPLGLLDEPHARAVVDLVERELWTPRGLRSLGPAEAGYTPRYEGGPAQRDSVYHQGAVWPWLAGAFVEAWVRVYHQPAEARVRFVAPLVAHLEEAGLGHLSELTDAEAPFDPRGCPFQAWSLAELIRLEHGVLAHQPRKEELHESDRDPPRSARRVGGRAI